MPAIPRTLLALSSLLLAPAALAQPVPTIVIPGPVAPLPPNGPGQGMCMASDIVERNGQGEYEIAFGTLSDTNYDPTINTFLEERVDDRVEYVVRTPLDLSNNNLADPTDQTSLGDYRDVSPGCQSGGCGFFLNDTDTAFVARLRGLLSVTPEVAGRPLHIGFYADDAVSLTIFNKDLRIFKIMTRPPQIGSPTWRLTQAVMFEDPGLYAVEILYTQIVEHAALEMAFFVGTFQDFERQAAQEPVTQLDEVNFTLFQPADFFQAISGVPSFANLDQCQQCNRQFVGMAGNNGCPGGYYCNEAALCAPCDTALFCGPSCSPCGGTTPFCINQNGRNECVECEDSSDCQPDYQCNPDTHVCELKCDEDEDCERGKYCDLSDGECKWCDQSDQCAGNSCNCCPTGEMGPAMRCEPLQPGDSPVCIECRSDAECPEGKVCDPVIYQCLDGLVSERSPAACGSNLEQCDDEWPFCIQSSDQLNDDTDAACQQCRWDLDCPDQYYCNIGECALCVDDRRCGPRCTSCGGDAPYCLGDTPASARCVGCEHDSQCESGACNPDTHACDPVCMMSCGAGLVCYGDECVPCYADVHCGCDGTCDTATFQCISSCKGNKDCMGNQHCRDDGGGGTECAAGPVPSNILCPRPPSAGCAVTGSGPPSPWLPGVALVIGVLMLRGRRRQRRQRP